MNKIEICNKLQYVLKSIELDENRKKLLNEVIMNLYDFADKDQNPDMTKYVLKDDIPSATSDKVGGIKSQATGTTSGRDYFVEVDDESKAKVNVPWTDTTYSAATSSRLGLVKQGATVAALESEDEIATVIARVNTLIANLKTAGIIANS